MITVINSITEEETEILNLLAKGQTNHEIAGKLYVSVSKIKLLLGVIMRKLNVNTRVGAVVKAIKEGIIEV